MSWFIFALISSTLFTSSIITDKYLLVGKFAKLSELSLTTAAALAGIPLLLVFIFLADSLPSAGAFLNGLIAGWLVITAYQLYYIALRKTDPALIATLFQLTIVFNLVAGITLFHERPDTLQYLGVALISGASIALSLEEKEKKWALNWKPLLLMITASVLLTTSDVVFKHAAETMPFITLSIAEYGSSVLAGLLLFAFIPRVRRELKKIRPDLKKSIGLLEMNEAFTLLATLAMRYAIVIGPLALVQAVMGTQPFIAVVITAVLGFFGLKLVEEKLSKKHLTIRIALILVAVVGSILITRVEH